MANGTNKLGDEPETRDQVNTWFLREPARRAALVASFRNGGRREDGRQ